MLRGILIPIITLVFSVCALELDTYARGNLTNGPRYTSPRAAGMGDVMIPFAEDAISSLFYNPALLSRLRKPELDFVNVSLYGNVGYLGMTDATFYKVADLRSFLPNLNGKVGQTARAGAIIAPALGFPGFGFGLLMQSKFGARANEDGTVYSETDIQVVPAFGFGFKLLDGVIRVGYSLQWVTKVTGSSTGSAADASYLRDVAQGSGVSHNAAVTVAAPMRSRPAFHLVVRDILNTAYRPYTFFQFTHNSIGVPSTQPMTVDTAFSIQPSLGHGVLASFGLEYRDATNRSGASFMGHFAVGGEITLINQLAFRGGMSEGYPTAGVSLKRKSSEISFAYFIDEVGGAYLNSSDAKYLLAYQLSF